MELEAQGYKADANRADVRESDTVKEDKEVEVEIKELRASLDQLESSISVLHDALGRVMYPSVQSEKGETKVPALVPLALDLRKQNTRIANLINLVNDMLSGLQL